MPLDISIPTTTVSSTAKPFTIYNISIRQPLRTLKLPKRYTDFVKLHDTLTAQTGAPPPAPLPAKSWFARTVNNPQLTEQRRVALEAYLRAIENDPDARWRHSSAWRTFLDLGTSGQRKSEGASSAAGPGIGGGVSVRDAATWLSVFQELKGQLHAARVALTRREQAQSAQAQHEAGAAAKKGLVLAGTLIAALDEGLRVLGGGAESNNGNGRKKGDRLGEGELRRRRDLIASARKEKEGLEGVLSAMVVKNISTANAPSSSTSSTAGAAANPADKAHLFHNGNGSSTTTTTSRRTLGAPQETARTRELDNSGVLQLQKQIMSEQDEDVVDLTKALRRMREMGVQINDELQLQTEMLRMLDDDVERVGGKIDVAKNRIKKIS
ncbi:uncharacterized protein J3D65DRAFT_559796 [Phyllosticta citribraziliensis]|uniref:Phox-like protein n=1 Tax=Phyllosticta citribraziliensis TaxID=989973 RepID=A0ABR1LA71_9PEZI